MSADPHPRRLPPEEPCRNCGDPTPGRFCPACGQRRSVVAVSLRAVVGDVLEDQLVMNPTLPRTVAALLAAPGRLTNEYIRGRVVRYIAPFRLYLAASVLFFLVFSFYGLRALDRVSLGGPDLSVDVDSARAELIARRDALRAQESARVNTAERVLVQQMLANTEAALAILEDTLIAQDEAARRRVIQQARGGAALPPGSMQPWAEELRLNAGAPWLQRAAERKLAEIGHLPPGDAIRAILGQMLTYAPHMVFLLLPVFALLLKLLYIRQRRYYTEHFVFALHVHAFFFLAFLLILLLPWGWARSLLTLWMLVYVWLAMKRVYRQGWIRTTLKWGVLGWAYFFVFSFGLLGLTVATLLFA